MLLFHHFHDKDQTRLKTNIALLVILKILNMSKPITKKVKFNRITVENFIMSSSEAPNEASPICCESSAKLGIESKGT